MSEDGEDEGGEERGRHRSHSEEDIAARVRVRIGQESTAAMRTERRERTERQLIEIFGADGDGGRFAAMEKDMHEVKTTVLQLQFFKVKVLAWAAAGGLFAGIAMKLLDHLVK